MDPHQQRDVQRTPSSATPFQMALTHLELHRQAATNLPKVRVPSDPTQVWIKALKEKLPHLCPALSTSTL